MRSERSLGTLCRRSLETVKLKGSDTYGVFVFLLDAVAEKADQFGPDARALVGASECLNNMVELWASAGVRLTDAQYALTRNVHDTVHVTDNHV